MAITASGIGSGLDINGIVRQLMTIERQPLNRLEARESEHKAELSAIGKLSSSLDGFQSALEKLSTISAFKVNAASSTDEDTFTATATSSASKGQFDLDVTRIAERHKQASGLFADKDTTALTGTTTTITVGADAFTVDFTGMTLEEARDAINDADDNTGVSATILNVDGGYRLTLSADETGSDNFISTSFGGGDPFGFTDLNTDRDASGTFDASDLDAVFTIDGTYSVTSSSNAVTDVIDGVTVNLVAAGTGTINVDRDDEAIKASVDEFVEAYNALNDTVRSMRTGELQGDGLLRSIESQLRSVFNTPASGLGGSYSYLAEVGVTAQADGSLAVDADDLTAAMDADFSGFAKLFGDSTDGFAARFDSLIDQFTDLDGIIASRKENIDSTIRSIGTRKDRMEYRLERKEASLSAQYTALDSLVGQMNSTNSFLVQQLSSL